VDVQMINPFIEATMKVLETMASTKAKAQKAYVKKDKKATGDVSGIIGITGEAMGTISVSFSASSILAIVSKMFGEEMSEINDDIGDAVGELTNMISGQARQQLEAEGRLLKAAIPTVIMGKNHSISHITDGPIIAIPFETDNGSFAIEICLGGKSG
jgi:chemotaxis protein CheX